MKLIFRIKCAFWLWHLSSLSALDSWSYARGIVRDSWEDREEFTARDAVEIEMSYWEDPE